MKILNFDFDKEFFDDPKAVFFSGCTIEILYLSGPYSANYKKYATKYVYKKQISKNI